MKVSLNAIQGLVEHYGCADDVTAIGVDKLVEKIGALLAGVDEVSSLSGKYKGIIIAKVAECTKHDNADKLRVCKLYDGGVVKNVERDSEGLVQVVCGAPNVREGLSVAWLPPGATVPETYCKDPFVLEKREIRGVVSNGMVASPKELGLGDSHDGILEIDGDHKPGTDFAKALGLDDVVIDMENKMFSHRPDCFGFLGIARELAGIQQMPFKSPDWYRVDPDFPAVEAPELPLAIKNELPELVPRFTAIAMGNVQVGPSPLWLRIYLAKAGQKSINNIVDYTNWFMLETGQPLHAYDYDKVKDLSQNKSPVTLYVGRTHGQPLQTLDGKTHQPLPADIMIKTDACDIGFGGVIGGQGTAVEANTTNIILECANFDMYTVRRTSMAQGIFTDAVTRFTKGQSPLQNLAVLAKIVDEIRENAGGKVAGPVIDEHGELSEPSAVSVTADFINRRLGLTLTEDEISQLLTNVEFSVNRAEGLAVRAPFWRTDIELPEDVVEEVGRLYGYDHLPLELPKRDLSPASKDGLLSLKAQIRSVLAKGGANELLTYSFVHGDLLGKTGQDKAQAFQIANALSPDLQYYRLNLTPSLLEKVQPNIKAGYDQFALFELGKAHVVGLEQDGLPAEMERLALVFAADMKAAKHYGGASYYEARKYLINLVSALKIEEAIKFEPLDPAKYEGSTANKISYLEPGRSATVLVGNTVLGELGEYKAAVRRALKLPDFVAGFELDLSVLLNKSFKLGGYVPLPSFPPVLQDITLRVPVETAFQDLHDFVWSEIARTRAKHNTFLLTPLDIYQKEGDPGHKNITFRLDIASYERTLTDAEVNTLLDHVAAAALTKLGAERV